MLPRVFVTLALGAVVSATAAGAAEGPGAGSTSPEAGIDPIVQDVVRMLEEGVESRLIVEWLERADSRPSAISADDMIRLTHAGASEGLIQRLIELSRRRSRPVPLRPSALPHFRRPTATATETAHPEVEFSITFRPWWDPEEDSAEDGDLYGYIDGEILFWMSLGGSVFARDDTKFFRDLAPGAHTIRLLRERHEQPRNDEGRWIHRSLVCPEPIEFELGEGPGWKMTIRWADSRNPFRRRGPLSWTLAHGDRRVAGVDRIGTSLDAWPLLCDDLEAGVEPGAKKPRRLERELRECLRWSALWPGAADAPTRLETLETLTGSDFRPPATR